MALFQPTNIYPSSLGELGNGTIDVTKPLAVSWQVNGNSAMTAFSLTIYKNDAGSTQVYTTGKQTAGCPFYGTDYAGNTVFFSYTIPASALSGAGMTNGQQYKLVIKQWWGATDTESVTQRSASVFLTRAEPTVTVTAIPSPLAVRKYAFTATYTQAQGDALNWVQWTLRTERGETLLYDSGRIYGTAELRLDYDGLFPGTAYAVRCQVQTENGIQADSGWVNFQVEYDTATLLGAMTVCAGCKKSGVRVSWPGLYDIPGTAAGDNRVENGTLVLGPDGSVVWDKVTGQPMNFPQPWSLVWSGTVDVNRDNPIVTIGLSEGGAAVVTLGVSGISLTVGGEPVWSDPLDGITPADRWSVVLSGGNIYLRQATFINGLYPANDLYPGAGLYPTNGDPFLKQFRGVADLSGRAATALTLGGVQTCEYLWVSEGTLTEEQLGEILSLAGWKPVDFPGGSLFQTNFAGGGFQAGNIQFSGTLTGFAIYRYREGDARLELVAQTPIEQRAVWDCKAVSGETYRYYMFSLGQNEAGQEIIITAPLTSDPVTPLFWDWTLLECTRDEAGAYHPKAIFRFALNVASGEIGNNNSPSVLGNFTRYPTVQTSPSDYRSGTLSAAIGRVLASGEYTDTNEVRDAIYGLSTTQDTLFLKDRRGDLWMIRAGGAIAMNTMDGSRQQAQTVTLPWVETGTVDGARIILTADDALFS